MTHAPKTRKPLADEHEPPTPSRRTFLKGAVASAALATGKLGQRATAGEDDQGVASGDPKPTSVVLWTRVPGPFQTSGTQTVSWEVATSESFAAGTVVTQGTATTSSASDHTVRLRAEGLSPFTWYWYRFRTASGYVSATGRTLTAPAADANPQEIRFAFVSCSNYNGRHWNVYDAMVKDDLHYVAHLGDNVYEGSLGYTAKTLTDFRDLHKLYLSTPQLREARRLFPWVHTWDDHEVFNNYHGGEMTTAERAVQAAGYQAFSEFMPLDPTIRPVVDANGVTELRIYRTVSFGGLMDFFVTDGRQYRDAFPCGREILVGPCDDLYDPERSMLGRAQTDWLKDGLGRSGATWKFLLNGTVMMSMKLTNPLRMVYTRLMGDTLREESDGIVINLDQWDGFPVNREEILSFCEVHGVSNVVVLTGDIHNCFAGQLLVDFNQQRRGEAVGVEVVTGSVTSSGIAETVGGYDLTNAVYAAFQPANPHIDFVDAYYHVYTKMTVRPSQVTVNYVGVSTVTSATYEVVDVGTLVIPEGEARVLVE